jgi:hypothetical protein
MKVFSKVFFTFNNVVYDQILTYLIAMEGDKLVSYTHRMHHPTLWQQRLAKCHFDR